LRFVAQVGAVTPTANLGIRQVREKIAYRALSAMVGKNATASEPPLGPLMTTFYTYLHPTPAWLAFFFLVAVSLYDRHDDRPNDHPDNDNGGRQAVSAE